MLRDLPRLSRVAALLIAVSAAIGPAHAEVTRAAESAAAWVAARQAADGGFFADAQPADATAEAVAALASAGGEAAGRAIGRALAHLRRTAPERASRPAYAGRIAMGIVAAGQDPRAFGGVNYVERISSGYNAASGAYESGVYADALAILGLAAAREPAGSSAITYLRANQCSDGGFAHDPGCVPRADTDTTAVVVCALAAMGVDGGDLIVSRAREWLHATRAAGGGWPHFPGGPVNANSTGLGVSAASCLGERDDASAGVLRSLQTPSGGVRYQAGDEQANSYATVQAIPALAGSGYPVRAAGRGTSAPGPAASSPAGAPVPEPATSSPAAPAASEPATVVSPEKSDSSDRSDVVPEDRAAGTSAPPGDWPAPARGLAGMGAAIGAAVVATALSAVALRRRRRA